MFKRLLKLLGLNLSSHVGQDKLVPLPIPANTQLPVPVQKLKKTSKAVEKTTRELMVQVDLAKNMTTVFSQYPPSENLLMQLDALCITIAKCIEEGEKPEAIHQKVKFYLDTTTMRYQPYDKAKTN